MKMRLSTVALAWLLLISAAAISALVLIGCAQKKSESETPAAAQQTAPQAAAPTREATEHGESGEAVTPASSVHETWTQIAEEQGKLSAAIQNGQLKDVHHLAFGIRDLVVALADKAGASSPAVAPKLKDMVEQVKASANQLDELGDAGNLSGTQAEFAKLDNLLKEIKALTSAQ